MKEKLILCFFTSVLGLYAALLDHTKVSGPESCGECHTNEVEAWKKTPHSFTFNEMHRRPEAQAIARSGQDGHNKGAEAAAAALLQIRAARLLGAAR